MGANLTDATHVVLPIRALLDLEECLYLTMLLVVMHFDDDAKGDALAGVLWNMRRTLMSYSHAR